MRPPNETVLITGATGLVGGATLRRMLRDDPRLDAIVLVRDLGRWRRLARAAGFDGGRVTPVVGDVREAGCGLDRDTRAALGRRVTTVVHAAADVVFSHPLAEARATNVDGVRHLVETMAAWPRARRIAHVSTAYVAGRRPGRIGEDDREPARAWVNPYEQSKAEAEEIIRATDREWVLLRSGYIVCDSILGRISQFNAAHLALWLLHEGRVPALPGTPRTTIDVVTTDYVAAAIATLARRPAAAGRTFHLCAGAGALPLSDAFDLSWRVWSEDAGWRARDILAPRLIGPAAYRLLSTAIACFGGPTAAKASRSLSHFVPHLALEQSFDTTQADATLGFTATPVRDFWRPMLRQLLSAQWGADARKAAA